MSEIKYILTFFFIICLFSHGFSQDYFTTIENEDDFYGKIDMLICNEERAGRLIVDTSSDRGIFILFEVKIDTNCFNHRVSIIKSYGITFLPGSIDTLCNWVKEFFSFDFIVEITPRWRFVNDVCSFIFPYTNFNNKRDSRFKITKQKTN